MWYGVCYVFGQGKVGGLMDTFKKTVRLGTTKIGGRWASVFCRIEWDGARLSISGVEGPLPSGNCLGGCGQIDMHNPKIGNLAQGWTRAMLARFWQIWERWHLNDMNPGDVVQMGAIAGAKAAGWKPEPGNAYESTRALLGRAGLVVHDGYEYGTTWVHESVPEDVLQFLVGRPPLDRRPAWV